MNKRGAEVNSRHTPLLPESRTSCPAILALPSGMLADSCGHVTHFCSFAYQVAGRGRPFYT